MDALLAALTREHPNYSEFVRLPPVVKKHPQKLAKRVYPQPIGPIWVKTDVISINQDLIERALADGPKQKFNSVFPTITVNKILEAVSAASGGEVLVSDIHSSRRFRNLCHWRHIAVFLCRKHTIHSFPEIGRRIGEKDHSTIHHSVRKVEHNMLMFSDDIAKVERLLHVR